MGMRTRKRDRYVMGMGVTSRCSTLHLLPRAAHYSPRAAHYAHDPPRAAHYAHYLPRAAHYSHYLPRAAPVSFLRAGERLGSDRAPPFGLFHGESKRVANGVG